MQSIFEGVSRMSQLDAIERQMLLLHCDTFTIESCINSLKAINDGSVFIFYFFILELGIKLMMSHLPGRH